MYPNTVTEASGGYQYNVAIPGNGKQAEGPISMALHEQKKQLLQAHQALDGLEQRLLSVLGAAPPAGLAGGATRPEPIQQSVMERLSNHSEMLSGLISRLGDLTQRVQL